MASSLDRLIDALPSLAAFHAPSSPVYEFLASASVEQVLPRFGEAAAGPQLLAPFGSLTFPYHRMGAIDSVDLFGLDELILFAFYWHNRHRYKSVLDLGANLGLHSIILSKCGFSVRAFEPDAEHYRILCENLALNSCRGVEPINAAVSDFDGTAEFIRVLGNTTSSHLAGSKDMPYGELERIQVDVLAVRPLLVGVDLVKLDVEGQERQVVCATTREDWQSLDVVMEVGSREGGARVFEHCRSLGLNLFAQRSGWAMVRDVTEMPTSYRDGSLFVTRRDSGPWS